MKDSNSDGLEKPPVNQVARIVNSLFLDSDYQGKDWEAVRKELIPQLTAYINEVLEECLPQKFKSGQIVSQNNLPYSYGWNEAVEEMRTKAKKLMGEG